MNARPIRWITRQRATIRTGAGTGRIPFGCTPAMHGGETQFKFQ
jgi:hypothetical protein